MTNIVLTESQMKYVLDYILNEKMELQEKDAQEERMYLSYRTFLDGHGFDLSKPSKDGHAQLKMPHEEYVNYKKLISQGKIDAARLKTPSIYTLGLNTGALGRFFFPWLFNNYRYTRGINTDYCTLRNEPKLSILCDVGIKDFIGKYLNKQDDILQLAMNPKYSPDIDTLEKIGNQVKAILDKEKNEKDIENKQEQTPELYITNELKNLLMIKNDNYELSKEEIKKANHLKEYISNIESNLIDDNIEYDDKTTEIIYDYIDFLNLSKQMLEMLLTNSTNIKNKVTNKFEQMLNLFDNPPIYSLQLKNTHT